MALGKGFSTGHYGYGRIEEALGTTLGIGETVQRNALRSRIKRLARLGLPKSLSDQEGRRLYSMEECHQILVGLLLGNVVHDPTIVAPAVIRAWKHNLRDCALEASQEANRDPREQNPFEGNPIILHAALRIVTEPWRTGNPNTALRIVHLKRRYSADTTKLAKKLKMTDGEAARAADLLVKEFEALHWVEWSASLNYTEAANELQRALHRED